MMKKVHIRKQPFTDEELKKLENAIATSKDYMANLAGEFLRARDIAIIKIAYLLGTRPAETLCLKWSDIDVKNKKVFIDPYTNKERQLNYALLSNKALKVLRAYKHIFDKFVRSPFVFPSLMTFEPLTTDGFDKRLLRHMKQAGITKMLWVTEAGQPIYNRTFYSLRKHFGTKLYRKTRDPYIVKRALRHETLRAGSSYVFVSDEEATEAIEQTFL